MTLLGKERHEEILGELLNPELEQSKRTELLTELRGAHNSAHEYVGTLDETNKTLKKNNDDLILANSQLFRSQGITPDSKQEKEEKKKEFSETITLSQIEAQAKY
jgi:Phi29 scaffolding protein